MTRLRKILLITFLVVLISYDPGAVEMGGKIADKLTPYNIRLTNSFTDSKEFTGMERIISSFMRRWEIAGASIAVAKDGKLVFAKGFGVPDKSMDLRTEPYNKFRIASISKLVTAIAVMKLQEDGKLSVNDKVFGDDGILKDAFYNEPKDKRVHDITVAHLLSHEGGWTTRWGDQMFIPFVVAEQMGVTPPVDTRTFYKQHLFIA